MRQNNFLVIPYLLLLCFLSSCLSSKRLYYFHNQQDAAIDTIAAQQKLAIPVIQSGDRVSITVSCQDPLQSAFLNPFNSQNSGSGQVNVASGYLVNDKGEIDFPLLGKVKIAGYNSDSAASVLKWSLKKYYKDPYVYVAVSGKVFFLSGKGGNAVPITNERLTIFEGLVQAGFQDAFDRKNKVWLVREEAGLRKYIRLNLNDKSIFQSNYYYLHTNDLVYIEPSKVATFLSNNSPVRNAIAISASVLALVFAITR